MTVGGPGKAARTGVLAGALCACAVVAQAQTGADDEFYLAHVHGLARLAVVVDGPLLTLALEAPLHDLAGFEHRPRSAEEQGAVAQMMAALNAPSDLFAPTAAAGCSPVRIVIESPWLAEDDASHAANGHAHEHDAEHPDLYAEFHFHCDEPAALEGVSVELFARFPGIERIDVELSVPGREDVAWLDAGRRHLRWR